MWRTIDDWLFSHRNNSLIFIFLTVPFYICSVLLLGGFVFAPVSLAVFSIMELSGIWMALGLLSAFFMAAFLLWIVVGRD